MKREFTVMSSATYHIDPRELRRLNLELMQRNRDNAYTSHREYKHLTSEQRAEKYDELKQKIRTEGFNDAFPILIMIVRKNGTEDKILQGHHRLNIAIELNLLAVAVKFVY